VFNKKWTGKFMEISSQRLIRSTIPEDAWRDWWKKWKPSGRIAGIQTKNQTGHLLNTSLKHYHSSKLARCVFKIIFRRYEKCLHARSHHLKYVRHKTIESLLILNRLCTAQCRTCFSKSITTVFDALSSLQFVHQMLILKPVVSNDSLIRKL
jgi:hypothetical protein